MANGQLHEFSVLVSVLTPTWNRAAYLKRAFDGLKVQSFKDFEWIVANDGSTDDTIDVVKLLAKDATFPITLISSSVRVGKSRMDNLAVREARGKFIIWCDSDDWFLPDALKIFVETWNSIPFDKRSEFGGITALCATKDGVLDNMYPDAIYTDVIWNDVLSKMKYDVALFCRSELLKRNPFVEVDYLIPETSVWNVIGVLKTRFVSSPLVFVNYGSDNCLSWNGLMEYNRGRAYAFAISKPYAFAAIHIRHRAWRVITYLRYCIHGEIPLGRAIRLWGGGAGAVAGALIGVPVAMFLAAKDGVQGKVRKTHREFDRAVKSSRIKIETLNRNDSAL